jgi:hypothetical protein
MLSAGPNAFARAMRGENGMSRGIPQSRGFQASGRVLQGFSTGPVSSAVAMIAAGCRGFDN